eukprot:TRINITY_DN10464_c0_g1_i4.p1 TRINITY_DN10464_c0_g1~~TRINITY_DN10464_c0_g1_i4.p1  ORF type:complete len:584 (-),score=39.93 TRINITY_DN10464_c0_g1_i4:546-2060(-)
MALVESSDCFEDVRRRCQDIRMKWGKVCKGKSYYDAFLNETFRRSALKLANSGAHRFIAWWKWRNESWPPLPPNRGPTLAKYLKKLGDVNETDVLMGFGMHCNITRADMLLVDPNYPDRWLKMANWQWAVERADLVQWFMRLLDVAPGIKQPTGILGPLRLRLDTEGCRKLCSEGHPVLNRIYKGDRKFDSRGRSYGNILREFMDEHVQFPGKDASSGYVDVYYDNAGVSKFLTDKGFIKCSRLYATTNNDPFQLPSSLNSLLTSKYYVNVDDSKAHVRYMRMMTNRRRARKVLDAYLEDPDTWIDDIAKYYGTDKLKVKQLVHTLGMDGRLHKWKLDYLDATKWNLKTPKKLEQYERAVSSITKEVAKIRGAKKAIASIQERFPEKAKRTKAILTWKSSLLHEIEAVSLQAKMAVANDRFYGHGSPEHDGLKLFKGEDGELDALPTEDLKRILSKAATDACHEFTGLKTSRTWSRCLSRSSHFQLMILVMEMQIQAILDKIKG